MEPQSAFKKSVAALVLFGLSVATFARFSKAQERLSERITGTIDEGSRSVVQGHLHPLALPQLDEGRLDGQVELNRITVMFKRTEAQQASLDAVLQEQQDPSSPRYHQWLTPEEFGDRFGLSASDLDIIVGWLEAQGFTVNERARSRSWVAFSGTVQQVESVLHTELHRYVVNGIPHYAAVMEPSVPFALGNVVLGFGSLDDFRLRPRVKSRKVDFTSTLSGNHFLTPDDLATIYDIRNLYNAGIDGTGQTIAVMGQTDILVSDINAFRAASGLPVTRPTLILVPGSGDPGIDMDELVEADLDIEWAGAVAPRANIIYVNSGNGVFDSLE